MIVRRRPEVVRITVSAMLVALSVVIIWFMPGIVLPFWSGTLASHVPQIISIFLGPFSAAAVALGSAVTFSLKINILVGARAFSHIIFSLVAWILIKRGVNRYVALIAVGPIHALAEALIMLFFAPEPSFYTIWYTTGLFTLIHHYLDCAIAFPILEAVNRTRLIPLIGFGRRNKILENI